MAIVDLDSLKTDQTISFKTWDPNDGVTWVGKILGIGSYTLMSGQADLMPTYRAIKKVRPTMDPIDKLSYLMLQITQGDKTARKVVAKEWLQQDSVQIINTATYFDVRIYDLDSSQEQTVLDLLSSHGIKCATFARSTT